MTVPAAPSRCSARRRRAPRRRSRAARRRTSRTARGSRRSWRRPGGRDRACGPPRAGRRRRRGRSGRSVSWTRSWARATIASSTTATAAIGRSPRDARELRLGQRFAHEQLVVHAAMLADGSRGLPSSDGRPTPDRNQPAYAAGAVAMPARMSNEADRDPDRRRRRPRPQRRHQERRLSRDRGGLRRPRHPPRLGGADPRPARAPDGGGTGYLRPLDRINTRTIDRTGGTILHTSRTNPRKMRGARAAGLAARGGRGSLSRSTRRLRPDAARARQPRRARDRRAGHDRRRRHPVVLAGPGRRRRAAHGHPQDDGQRRPGHRVLHRLLDRDHPGARRPSTASGRRSARTSGSASSGSSGAMPGSRRCTPRT